MRGIGTSGSQTFRLTEISSTLLGRDSGHSQIPSQQPFTLRLNVWNGVLGRGPKVTKGIFALVKKEIIRGGRNPDEAGLLVKNTPTNSVAEDTQGRG